MVEKIKRIVQPWISQGKLIFALGGEHTITVALLQAMQTRYPDLTVVALDAHADLQGELRRQQTLPCLRHAPGL